jgi:hypothetical protein
MTSSLGEDFLQKAQDLRDIQLDVFKVEKVFVVFLLRNTSITNK